jgi:hypothetical protein
MSHNIGWYFPLIIMFIVLLATWIFGDWRNWKTFYPSILFVISIDFVVSIITYNFTLWHFEKTLGIPNHSVGDFFLTFLNFPAIVLLYLTRYPFRSRVFKQLGYIFIWVVFFSLVEVTSFITKVITYHNGWNYGWSLLVWISMFIGIRIHHTKPLWAWLFFFAGIAFMMIYFHIPISKMK